MLQINEFTSSNVVVIPIQGDDINGKVFQMYNFCVHLTINWDLYDFCAEHLYYDFFSALYLLTLHV